jgi:hypothetical protein
MYTYLDKLIALIRLNSFEEFSLIERLGGACLIFINAYNVLKYIRGKSVFMNVLILLIRIYMHI